MLAIEVIGLSGAGKSSVIKEVKNKEPSFSLVECLLEESLLKSVKIFDNVSLTVVERLSLFVCKNFLFRFWLTKKVGVRIFLACASINQFFFNDYFLKAPKLFLFVKENWSRKNDDFFSAYLGFVNSIVKIKVLQKSNINEIVLVDEGPLKYLQSLLRYTSDNKLKAEIVYELLDKIPSIVGCIFINSGDHNTLFKRLNQRQGKVPFNLRNKSTQLLEEIFSEEESNIVLIRRCIQKKELEHLDLRFDAEMNEKIEEVIKFVRKF